MKYRRSTWIFIAMLVYVTGTAIYVLPHNLIETSFEKTITLFVSYVISFLLWLLLRRKENIHRKNESK